MQTYKLFFKILRKSALASILLFIAIFSAITILFSKTYQSPVESFELTKCKVAIIDHDQEELSKELTNYLNQYIKPVTVNDDEDSFKDALFFREVHYIAIIPKGFTEAFLSGNPMEITSMQLPDGVSAKLVDNIINSYLQTAKLYLKGTGKVDYAAIQKDLSISTEVKMVSGQKDTITDRSSANFYVDYFCYPILSIMILAIPMIMLSVNEPNVKRRCIAAPLNQTRFTLQLLCANLMMMLIILALFALIAVIMYPDTVISIRGIWWLLNALSFSTFSLCFGYFIANLIQSKSTIWAIANCAALGLGFLGGAFVPQELLDETILKFDVINPVYWFIKGNNTLDRINTWNMETLNPILFSIFIQFGFAIAFAAMTLVVVKYKHRSN